MSKKIIYIIDNDPIYQIITKKIFEKFNAIERCHFFVDGKEAIEYILRNHKKPETLPDIILLDIEMPIMDGWEFMESYTMLTKNISKNSEIYIVSSSIAISDKIKAQSYKSILGFLSKPVAIDVLESITKT